ncbi:hypothetical protein HDV00_007127, partial [Rhizophlyctis rosea]
AGCQKEAEEDGLLDGAQTSEPLAEVDAQWDLDCQRVRSKGLRSTKYSLVTNQTNSSSTSRTSSTAPIDLAKERAQTLNFKEETPQNILDDLPMRGRWVEAKPTTFSPIKLRQTLTYGDWLVTS